MAENDAAGAQGGQPQGDGTDGAQGGQQPASAPQAGQADSNGKVLTQADVDRIVAERVARERAKYADHDDLKRKAAKLDEIEQANLTQQEKLQQQLEAAARERDELKASALRRDVADAKGVPANLRGYLAGATQAELEASADKVLADFTAAGQKPGEDESDSKANPGRRPGERLLPGASPTGSATTEDAYPSSWLPKSARARVGG